MSHLSKTLDEFVADGASPFGIECIKEIVSEHILAPRLLRVGANSFMFCTTHAISIHVNRTNTHVNY